MMPRWMHKLRAFLGSYFWLSCKLCSRKFGGHELSAVLYDSWNSGQVVCINCKDEAEQRNKILFATIQRPVMVINPAYKPESQTEIELEAETHFPDCGCRVCAEDRASRGEDYWDSREDR